MLILYVLILIAAVWGVRVRKPPSAESALSVEQSTMIKGLFVLLVFVSHLTQYLDLNDSGGFLTTWFLMIRGDVGQLVVVPFLFYSGYGLRCSIEKKGDAYLRAMPKNRILRVYLHAVVIAALFLLLQIILGNRYTLTYILAGFLFWESFGNSNWYIFAILLLYLFTWISFFVFRKRAAALISSFLLTAAYYFALSRLAESWWYDTVFAFWLGLIYPEIKLLLQRVLRGRTLLWLGAVLLSAAIVFLLTKRSFHLPYGIRGNIRAVFAMLLINLFLERIALGNFVLSWLGTHVFECYLLQRVPMLLLRHFRVQALSIPLFVLGSAVATVLLTLLFRKILDRFDRCVFPAH